MKLQTRESSLVRILQLQTILCAIAAAGLGLSSCGGGGAGGADAPPVVQADPLLAELGLPAGFRPLAAFDPQAAELVVTCRFPQSSISLAPVPANPADTVLVDGELLTPGRRSRGSDLREGDTLVAVRVQAADGGGVRDYRVRVQREFGTQFAQNAFIKASNPGQNDAFGAALAIDNDTLVVGAPFEDSAFGGDQTDNSAISAGAAYVFVRAGTSWRQEAYLKSPAPDANDQFGASVAVAGDLVVIGAPNEDGASNGTSGDPFNDSAVDSGAAYVFRRQAGLWNFDAYLKPSNTVAGGVGGFGTAVAISGATIAVGAPLEDSAATGVNGDQVAQAATVNSGAVYVFVPAGGGWAQQAYLKPFATDAGDNFGGAVAVDGDRVVVGARGDDGGGTGAFGDPENDSVPESGAAYTFVRTGLVWGKEAYVKASNTGTGDQFGSRVALAGQLLAVAARNERSLASGVNGNEADNAGLRVGAVYAFVQSGGLYQQEAYIKASNAENDDGFGEALALRGDMLVVGAQAEDSPGVGLDAGQGNGAFNAGAAYLYVRQGASWAQRRYMKASNTRNSGFYGSAVGIAPFGIAVAGSGDNSNSAGIDGSQASIGNFAGHGAVYTYE